MTNAELLDSILYCFAGILKEKLDGSPKYNKVDFKHIARSQEPDIPDWQIDFLKMQLFMDGFLVIAKSGPEEPYELTPRGIKAAQIGWYKSKETAREQDREIRKETLAQLKRSKFFNALSIASIIFSILFSIYSAYTGYNTPSREEHQDLQRRLEKLENQKPPA